MGDFVVFLVPSVPNACFLSFSSSESVSPDPSPGGENFHTTSSPFDVPAARTCPRPDAACAKDVTAPRFTSMVRAIPLPPNAYAIFVALQYLFSETNAARCACEGGGGSVSTPKSAIPDRGGGCAFAFASAAAASSFLRNAFTTCFFAISASLSLSESLDDETILSSLPSEDSRDDSPSPSPAFPFISLVSLKFTVVSPPRAIPGGGLAGRNGWVW